MAWGGRNCPLSEMMTLDSQVITLRTLKPDEDYMQQKKDLSLEVFLLAQFLMISRNILCKRISHLKQQMSLDRKSGHSPSLSFPAALSPHSSPCRWWWCFSRPTLDSRTNHRVWLHGVHKAVECQGSIDGERCHCWGRSWLCNLTTVPSSECLCLCY